MFSLLEFGGFLITTARQVRNFGRATVLNCFFHSAISSKIVFSAHKMSQTTTSIKQLSEDVASRISTASVIASLEGAVRQLIDNSLDAGATNIGLFLVFPQN